MKTNIKLDNKNKTIRPNRKKARVKKPKSNPLPIILISLGAFILLIIVLLLATNNKPAPQNDVATKPKTYGNDSKSPTSKKKTSTKKTKENTKKDAAPSGPELVGYNSNVLKPKGETESAEAVSTEPEENNTVVTSTPTEAKTETAAPTSNLPPKEQSIANLKKIFSQYKEYAANKQGHMPLALYQLDLNDSEKTSPLTNQQYVMTQEGKGSFLKDSVDSVIVREAQAVNGKYLCLIGNGEVREIDAGNIEE